MLMDELAPGTKPLFMQPDTDEGYPGIVELPKFDEEVRPLEAEAELMDEAKATEVPAQQRKEKRKLMVKERWSAVCRAYATGRFSIQSIAEQFNYSPITVSHILHSHWGQEEVKRYRDSFTLNIVDQIKEAAIDSVGYLHGTILDPKVKDETRSSNARFFVEKQTGKAHQSVTHQHTDLAAFMEVMNAMKARGEAIDVTPQPGAPALTEGQSDAPQISRFDAWLDENLG